MSLKPSCESELNEIYIQIRKAEAKDIYDVFCLSNLRSTRENSVNPDEISWENHVTWYAEVLKNDNVVLYVLRAKDDEFLGQVRYSIEFNKAVVSISLVEKVRGRGYGLDILLKSQALLKEEKKIDCITAIIKHDNKPSISIFERAGYKLVKSMNGFSEYIFEI